MEICTQHVLLKDNMYYFAAEVYSENAEAFVMPHVLLTTPKSCMFSYITVRQRNKLLFVVTWWEF